MGERHLTQAFKLHASERERETLRFDRPEAALLFWNLGVQVRGLSGRRSRLHIVNSGTSGCAGSRTGCRLMRPPPILLPHTALGTDKGPAADLQDVRYVGAQRDIWAARKVARQKRFTSTAHNIRMAPTASSVSDVMTQYLALQQRPRRTSLRSHNLFLRTISVVA